jgi:hypothetical protein
MCQPLPHGRCAADSRPAYQKAREKIHSLQHNPEYQNTTDPEKLKEYQTAQYNLMVRRLIYTATPEGLEASRRKIEEHNGSKEEIAFEKKMYEDALALREHNHRNVNRFFQEAAYKTDGSKDTFIAMPLSLTNIAQVNDWINDSFTEAPKMKQEEKEKSLEELEYGEEVEVPEEALEPVEEPVEREKTPTGRDKKIKPNLRVFNSRGKLHFEQEGKTYTLSEKAYLVREAGTKNFKLVPANKFETKYNPVVPLKEPKLNNIALGRVFPPTQLSNYIELASTRKMK